MSQKTEFILSARDETSAAFQSVQRNLSGLKDRTDSFLSGGFGGIGAALGGGLAAGLLGAGFTSAIQGAIDDLDKLDEAAERVGMTTESLSALAYAGKMSGVEFEDMTAAISRLSSKMQEAASGSKEASALFKDIGVSVKDSNGNLKSADTIMSELADRFSQFEDGAGKTALAIDIFGKSGAKLVPILNQGSSGLSAMKNELDSIGGIIDGKIAKQAADFNDNLDRLGKLSSAAGKSIAVNLIPVLNDVMEKLFQAKQSDLSIGQIMFDVLPKQEGDASDRIKRITREISEFQSMIGDVQKQNRYGWTDQSIRQKIEENEKLLKYLEKRAVVENRISLNGFDDNPIGFNPGGGKKIIRTPSTTAGSKQVDEAAKLIASLNEQIAVKNLDAQATEAMTAAEVEAAKIMAGLRDGTLKATDDQKIAIAKSLESIAELDKKLASSKEFSAALKTAETAMASGRSKMAEGNIELERQLDLYGLTDAQISAVTQSRLEEAIAIAKTNGASDESIAYMEEELALIEKRTDLLSAIDGKKQAVDAYNNGLKEQVNIARDLGMTFTSAFEDAAIGGKKFSDVLNALVQDLARLALRKSITEPVMQWFGSLDLGKLFSSSSSSVSAPVTPGVDFLGDGLKLPSFAVGTDYVPKDMIAMIHKGERITPAEFNPAIGNGAGDAGVVVNIHNNASGAQASQSTRQEGGKTIIDVMIEQVKSALISDVGRGGDFAGALEGTYAMNRSAGAWR